MAQIGLNNLFYAEITEDANGNETYGTPVRLAKAISAELNINSDNATLYADDGSDVTFRDFQSGTLTLGINELGTAVAAMLLGSTVDANGVLISSGEDNPPAVAIGFQSKSAKGGDRFMWFYRVTFGIPGASLNTKGESIEFATPSIEGTISRRNRVDGSGKHPWKAEVKDGVTGVDSSVVANWFNSVYEGAGAADATIEVDPEHPEYLMGEVTYTPSFSPNVTEYVGTIARASTTMTVQAASQDTSIDITINGNSITNGATGNAVYELGENIVLIKTRNGYSSMQYRFVVTRTA